MNQLDDALRRVDPTQCLNILNRIALQLLCRFFKVMLCWKLLHGNKDYATAAEAKNIPSAVQASDMPFSALSFCRNKVQG
jgi:hypothetical protein